MLTESRAKSLEFLTHGMTPKDKLEFVAGIELNDFYRAAELRGEILSPSFPGPEKELEVLIASSWSWTVDLSKSLLNEYGRIKKQRLMSHVMTLRVRGYMEDYHPTPLGYLILAKFAPERACFPKGFQGQLREQPTQDAPCSSQDDQPSDEQSSHGP